MALTAKEYISQAATPEEYMSRVVLVAQKEKGMLIRKMRQDDQQPTGVDLESTMAGLEAKWEIDYAVPPADTLSGDQREALEKKLKDVAAEICVLNRVERGFSYKTEAMTPESRDASMSSERQPANAASFKVKSGLFNTERGSFSADEKSIHVKIRQEDNTGRTTTLLDYKEVIIAALKHAVENGWSTVGFEAQDLEVAQFVTAAAIEMGLKVKVPAQFAQDPHIKATMEKASRSADAAAATMARHLGKDAPAAGERATVSQGQQGGGDMADMLRGGAGPAPGAHQLDVGTGHH